MNSGWSRSIRESNFASNLDCESETSLYGSLRGTVGMTECRGSNILGGLRFMARLEIVDEVEVELPPDHSAAGQPLHANE